MTHSALIDALRDPARYPHPAGPVELIEVHASWVLLTGPYAYKIKKPVDFGFLDFSTLERRRRFCEEELRLNRRLAPQLYDRVVPISGTPDAPCVDGIGEPIEYAVRMVQFPQEALLDRLLPAGGLPPPALDALADRVAAFHTRAPTATADSHFGEPERVHGPVRDNFALIREHLPRDHRDRALLARIEAWSEAAFDRLEPRLAERKRGGSIRECHGDMHLGNMVLLDGEVVIFDCIEFSPDLRWIDVLSEIAFLTMDIGHRGRPELARRLLNRYLEQTGDYAGMALFAYYQCYRAMVRAKVALLRAEALERDDPERDRAWHDLSDYLALANRCTRPPPAHLWITHGLSGSGKSTIAAAVVEQFGALRLRSDVERKRLAGLAPEAASGAALGAGLYGADATRRTYTRLGELTRGLLEAGWPVVVDATFLKRDQRAPLCALARRLGVGFTILSLEIDEGRLRERIARRRAKGGDASEATLEVLDHQLATAEPLTPEEATNRVVVSGVTGLDRDRLALIAARFG